MAKDLKLSKKKKKLRLKGVKVSSKNIFGQDNANENSHESGALSPLGDSSKGFN